MPQWRKFATSFVENRCYLFVTVSNLSKPATLADNLSYDKARLGDHVPPESPINVDLE